MPVWLHYNKTVHDIVCIAASGADSLTKGVVLKLKIEQEVAVNCQPPEKQKGLRASFVLGIL
jgi:hypothetical protein